MAITNDFMEQLKNVPGAVDVGLSEQEPKDELKIELDRGLANALGIAVGDAAQSVDPHACDALHAALHGGITLAGYAFEALRLPAGRAHEPLEAYARWRRHAFGRSGRLSRIANVFLRPEPVR